MTDLDLGALAEWRKQQAEKRLASTVAPAKSASTVPTDTAPKDEVTVDRPRADEVLRRVCHGAPCRIND